MLNELRNLPAFNAFEKAVKDNLNFDNYYVKSLAPYKTEVVELDGVRNVFKRTDEEVEQEGIENLLDDNNGYLDEFIHEVLRSDVTELVRALIKEIRK